MEIKLYVLNSSIGDAVGSSVGMALAERYSTSKLCYCRIELLTGCISINVTLSNGR